jgi:TRAP-type uncharacterized transport system substrate-binding protein
MQKSLVILSCALFFGALATSKASPLDSPDIVYIDGQPCNSACQSYMAWSRQIMPVRGQPSRVRARAAAHQQPPNAAARRATRIRETGSKPAANDRLAKQAAPTSTEMPQAKTTDLQPVGKAAATSDTAGTEIADSVSTVDTATHSATRTTFEQVTAAVAVAERLTATTTVAIVIARPEIKSVSDLAGRSIAIGNGQSASTDSVRTAILKAGAAEVQLTENQAMALGRMIGGEVPAAVLTLASPEAAERFPEIAGFKIFRIPLTSEISQPAANAAAPSDAAGAKIAGLPFATAVATKPQTRATQELVTAATAVAERITAATAVPQGVEKKTDIIDGSDRPETALSNDTDPRIAILMARPEIKSVSDLAGKEIIIDGKLSAATNHLETAIRAAGAAEVQLDVIQTNAIDRMIGGEASAVVLTLASPEAADGYPEVAGFRILQVPLTPKKPQAKVADLQPARAVAADTLPRSIQEQVAAATAIAERITAAKVDPRGSEQQTNSIDRFARSEIVLPGGVEKGAPAPSSDTASRIAILMARPEIKSVSDLTGKSIAIDDSQSASIADIRAAIEAAGAADVQVSEGPTQVINRLILAEVSAAVLTLVSPEAAEGFPEITGFRVLRIPLVSHSVPTRKP